MFTQTLKSLLAAALLIVPPVGLAQITEQDREHKFELAEKYYAECRHIQDGQFEEIRPYLKAFTDVEVLADTVADPIRFAKLMQIVSDPRTMHVMMKCSTEPVMWDTWVRGLTDFDKMARAGTRFMNPVMYMNWMMAPMNPQFYAPVMQMMNPGYYTLWMNAMMNPAFYQPMFAFMDPNWYTPRLQWMADPRSMEPLYTMFNFTTPTMIPASTTQANAAVPPAPVAAGVAPSPQALPDPVAEAIAESEDAQNQ